MARLTLVALFCAAVAGLAAPALAARGVGKSYNPVAPGTLRSVAGVWNPVQIKGHIDPNAEAEDMLPVCNTFVPYNGGTVTFMPSLDKCTIKLTASATTPDNTVVNYFGETFEGRLKLQNIDADEGRACHFEIQGHRLYTYFSDDTESMWIVMDNTCGSHTATVSAEQHYVFNFVFPTTSYDNMPIGSVNFELLPTGDALFTGSFIINLMCNNEATNALCGGAPPGAPDIRGAFSNKDYAMYNGLTTTANSLVHATTFNAADSDRNEYKIMLDFSRRWKPRNAIFNDRGIELVSYRLRFGQGSDGQDRMVMCVMSEVGPSEVPDPSNIDPTDSELMERHCDLYVRDSTKAAKSARFERNQIQYFGGERQHYWVPTRKEGENPAMRIPGERKRRRHRRRKRKNKRFAMPELT